MQCTLIGVFKETNKVCLQSLLEGKNGSALHLQIQLDINSNLEGCLSEQLFGELLVFTDLAKSNGPRTVTMGLLHATHSTFCYLSHRLCCKVQPWGLSPS
jgi:hypothetical protein